MNVTKLSVNVNKIALIRNSRGANYPDLLQMCLDLEAFGADGITVHPRPDQRHIKYDDIPILKDNIRTELNIEGYPSDDFIKLVIDNAPAQVTLVPDPPGRLHRTMVGILLRTKIYWPGLFQCLWKRE